MQLHASPGTPSRQPSLETKGSNAVYIERALSILLYRDLKTELKGVGVLPCNCTDVGLHTSRVHDRGARCSIIYRIKWRSEAFGAMEEAQPFLQ